MYAKNHKEYFEMWNRSRIGYLKNFFSVISLTGFKLWYTNQPEVSSRNQSHWPRILLIFALYLKNNPDTQQHCIYLSSWHLFIYLFIIPFPLLCVIFFLNYSENLYILLAKMSKFSKFSFYSSQPLLWLQMLLYTVTFLEFRNLGSLILC